MVPKTFTGRKNDSGSVWFEEKFRSVDEEGFLKKHRGKNKTEIAILKAKKRKTFGQATEIFCKILLMLVKFCQILLMLVKFCKILLILVKFDKILLTLVKFCKFFVLFHQFVCFSFYSFIFGTSSRFRNFLAVIS